MTTLWKVSVLHATKNANTQANEFFFMHDDDAKTFQLLTCLNAISEIGETQTLIENLKDHEYLTEHWAQNILAMPDESMRLNFLKQLPEDAKEFIILASSDIVGDGELVEFRTSVERWTVDSALIKGMEALNQLRF